MLAGDENYPDEVTSGNLVGAIQFPRHNHQCTCCGSIDEPDNPVFWSKTGKCWICDGCEEEYGWID